MANIKGTYDINFVRMKQNRTKFNCPLWTLYMLKCYTFPIHLAEMDGDNNKSKVNGFKTMCSVNRLTKSFSGHAHRVTELSCFTCLNFGRIEIAKLLNLIISKLKKQSWCLSRDFKNKFVNLLM